MAHLIFDPALQWEGPFPYAVLARLGVSPQSTASQILDASYAIVAEAATDQQLNDAWESLHLTSRRLFADFFCYEIDDPAPAVSAEGIDVVPWSLIESLEHIEQSISFTVRPTPEPNLPPQLADVAPLWEPGVGPKESAR
jgi:hypothetical protein